MIGKGATPSFFAIANDNYTLTVPVYRFQFFYNDAKYIREYEIDYRINQGLTR